MSASSYVPSPHLANMKKSPSYDGHSSGSEAKKASTPGAKRRPSRAGTRSVTTLTAAQLERKRANDREAQRAIRQRTKDHIESLERRIAELTTQHDGNNPSKIMELMRRNEELEQENAVLRSRLSHAVTALGGSDSNIGNVVGGADSGMLSATGGAPSPSDRIQMLSQPRRSSTGTARNVHSVPDQATPASQPGHWQAQHTAYAPHASPHIENQASLGDVGGQPEPVRWSPHPHPHPHPVAHQQQHQVSMDVQDPAIHAVDSAGMPYPYVLDPNNRPMNYSMDTSQIPQQTMHQIPSGYGTPTSNPSPHPPEYQRHLSVQMNAPPPPQQQAQYSQYSTHGHQGYVPQVSHPGEMQMMQQPQAMMNSDQGHIMYHMNPNMKVEPH